MNPFARVWDADPAIACLIGVPGIGGHSGDYEAWAGVLTGRGIAVCGYDYPGNGLRRSEPYGSPVTAVREAGDAVLAARARWSGRPVIAAGESLGALVWLALAGTSGDGGEQEVADGRFPDALVLTSPPLSTPGKLSAGRLALIVWRFMTGSKKPVDFTGRAGLLSADPAEVDDLERDSLRTRALPAAFLVGVRLLQRDALLHGRRVVVPTLILWGENDDVAAFPQTRRLLAAIPPALRTIEVRPGERHMLTRGASRVETAMIIARWVEETVIQRSRVHRASRAAR